MKIEVKNFITNGIITVEAAAEDLNMLAMVFSSASHYFDDDRYSTIKHYYDDYFQQIFDALKETGYYDGVCEEDNK